MWFVMTALAAPSWVLDNPRLLDVHGTRTVESLVVEDGRITHIGAALPAYAELEHYPARGTTIMPGLIDAHVHLTLAPGGAFIERTAAEVRAVRAHHLRAYVASGVVAVLDTGLPIEEAPGLLELVEAGPAPVVRLLGPLVSPPDGYVNAVLPAFPPTPDVATLHAQLEAFDAFDPIGVKVTMEDGMVGPIWEFHDASVLAALKAQPRPVFVHAMEPEEYDLALDTLDVTAFVHPLAKVDDERAARLANIPVVTTLSAFDSLLIGPEPERLDDPLVQLVVPAQELANAVDRKVQKASARGIANAILPRMFPPFRGLARSMMGNAGLIRGRTKKLSRAVVDLHAADVELVLGSDSGNWPLFLYEFHGPTTVREFELLVEAGVPFDDVLAMATTNGARLLGLDGELGTLEVGRRASFIVLEGDPREALSALRTPRWVAHDGELRTPTDWMDKGSASGSSTEAP